MALSDEDIKKIRKAFADAGNEAKKAAKNVATFGGVIFKASGQSKNTADELQKMITAMKGVTHAGGQEFVKTKALAQAELALGQMRVQAAAGSIALTGDLKKSMNAVEQFGTQQAKVWQASLANMIKPSAEMSKALTFMAPNFVRAQAGAQNVGKGMLTLNTAALGLTAGFSLLQFVISVFASAARGTSETYKTLTGAIGINATTVQRASGLYSEARLAGALFGATQEDILNSYKALGASAVLNKRALDAFGEVSIGASIGEFLGLTKAMGMSGEAANKLASSLVMAGGDMTKLPDQVARLQLAVDDTGLTTDILAEAIAGIAPISTASSQSTERLLNTFGGFATVFDKSNDMMLRAAREHGQFTRFTNAMRSFGQAISQISFQEMLAFGKGGPELAGVAPGRAIEMAVNTPRSDIFLNMLNQTMMQADNKLGKFTVGVALLEKRFGMDALRAADLTKMIIGLQEQEAKAQTQADRDAIEATKDSIRTSAAMTSLIQNPLERIRDIAESILGAVMDLLLFFRGRGSALGRVLAAAGRTAAAFNPSTTS